jgi:hypothetical protein
MAFNHIVFSSDYDKSLHTESGRVFVWQTHSKVNRRTTFCMETKCGNEARKGNRCLSCTYPLQPKYVQRHLDDIREDILQIEEKLSWPMSPGQTGDWSRLLNRRKAELAKRGADMWE